jgi:hypothetical protein
MASYVNKHFTDKNLNNKLIGTDTLTDADIKTSQYSAIKSLSLQTAYGLARMSDMAMERLHRNVTVTKNGLSNYILRSSHNYLINHGLVVLIYLTYSLK